MLVAIQDIKNSFSKNWIRYCQENSLNYKLVNCYSTTIMEDLKGCDLFLWNYSHTEGIAPLMAEALLWSLKELGIRTFPAFQEIIHFDNKLAQKYLFEAVNAPLVPSYLFFRKSDCLDWIESTTFPKVFKLSKGAGSANVILVQNNTEACRLCRRAFSRGFSPFNRTGFLKDRWRILVKKPSVRNLELSLKATLRLFMKTDLERVYGREKGYAYFQDYIPENEFDTRIIVIGHKAFGIRRIIRKGDFRASGSGITEYEHQKMDPECIRISFDLCEKLNFSCMGFDFIYDRGKPKLTEMGYSFTPSVYNNKCDGFWDKALNWYPGKFILEDIIMEHEIAAITSSQ